MPAAGTSSIVCTPLNQLHDLWSSTNSLDPAIIHQIPPLGLKLMNQSDFLVFTAPDIHEDEIAKVEACLRSGWLGTGQRVAHLESDFTKYKDVIATHITAANSCTAALHVSMVAANVKPGSEVITTPLTFCATVNFILHTGLSPALADVDPITQNIDLDAIEASITPYTRAILSDLRLSVC